MWQLDRRAYSPLVREKMILSAARAASFEQAAQQLEIIGEISISPRNLNSIANEIGQELVARREQAADAYLNAPLPRVPTQPQTPIDLACVEVDGGRIHVRDEAGGHGVFDPSWRESKVGLLIRMQSQTYLSDPHPQLPLCFREPQQVQTLLATLAGDTPDEDTRDPPTTSPATKPPDRWQPLPLVRTCVATLSNCHRFGQLVAQAADARGFYHARKKAFLGDGQKYNWTLHQRHFADFEPIVDFVHVVEYLYAAARAGWEESEVWSQYLCFATSCWQGQVSDVLSTLSERLKTLVESQGDAGRIESLRQSLGYLQNNHSRMQYVSYRLRGLPTTSSLVESQIKQLNRRVKGSEKFWKASCGGESMLELASQSLSEDDRLTHYLRHRPGHPFHRSSPNYSIST